MTARMLRVFVAFNIVLAVLQPVPAQAHESLPGRWVDGGDYNGLWACEARPTPKFGHLVPQHHPKKRAREVRADSRGSANDRGIFQVIPSTWDWVAQQRGKGRLIGRDPRSFTLATQLRQAEWLRTHGGIGHWTCGYRYGDGTSKRWVTGEWKSPRKPRRCANNLVNRHGQTRRVANSVCEVK